MKNVHLLDSWTFCRGSGDPAQQRACTMSAYSVLMGQEFSDYPTGVSYVLRYFIMEFNDSIGESNAHLRQQFAYGVLGHIGGTDQPEFEEERRELLVSKCKKLLEFSYINSTPSSCAYTLAEKVQNKSTIQNKLVTIKDVVDMIREICKIGKVQNEECTLTR